MRALVDLLAEKKDAPFFLADVSPPRGGERSLLEPILGLNADAYCVAYNPGKSVRADSLAVAHALQAETGKPAVFNLATRDMNRLALQSHLLGAQMLRVGNVLVVGGDPFSERELASVKAVNDFRPTELVEAVAAMSQGVDYRGLKLRGPATLCVGASVDPSKPAEAAARLARRKVVAGAQFLVTQAVYGAEQVEAFREAYARETAHPQAVPILFGLPVLSKDGLLFGKVPEQTLRELDAGRPGDEIALEQVQEFRKRGMHHFYLVAPILRGGVRDYGAAQALLRRAASA